MRKIIMNTLLLLAVALTAAAQDAVSNMRSCRPAMATQSHLRRAPLDHSLFCTTTTGSHRQLVVLAAFSDKAFKEQDPLTLWERVFNEEGLSEAPFYGSVHDYFMAQSYGQFDLTFDLHFITLADEARKYRSTDDDDENSKYLVQDIADSLQARGIDWSLYDWDDDGQIEQLLIVYAGKGMNAGGDRNTIWPHQWWLSQHENCEPHHVSSGDQDYIVDKYCCVQELIGSGYGSFGTICHEYSHCYGLPDFYYGSTSFVYNWDLMDYGNNNKGGFCPPCYSAHERMLMGWLEPTELTCDTIVNDMPCTADEPVAYLIRNDAHPDEYYIIENRQPTGWDRQLPGSGIVIFHIDYDLQVWDSEMPNTNTLKRYTIFPANNRLLTTYSSQWAYPYNGNDQLTDTSKPAATLNTENAEGTLFMSKPVTAMQVTDGLASFHFSKGIPTAIATATATPTTHYYTLQGHSAGTRRDHLPSGIYIVSKADGTTGKVVIK